MPDKSSSALSAENCQLEFQAVINSIRDARNVKYICTLVVPKGVTHIED
jgi:hypothetical protein